MGVQRHKEYLGALVRTSRCRCGIFLWLKSLHSGRCYELVQNVMRLRRLR